MSRTSSVVQRDFSNAKKNIPVGDTLGKRLERIMSRGKLTFLPIESTSMTNIRRLDIVPLTVACTRLTTADKPNIPFICVDDLRTERGCSGNSIVRSPNIDRIANKHRFHSRTKHFGAG
jgi:hypothetical protein